jgi:hypothetical protein
MKVTSFARFDMQRKKFVNANLKTTAFRLGLIPHVFNSARNWDNFRIPSPPIFSAWDRLPGAVLCRKSLKMNENRQQAFLSLGSGVGPIPANKISSSK